MQLSPAPGILPLWQNPTLNKPTGTLRRKRRKRLSLQAQTELIALIKDSAGRPDQDALLSRERAEELLGEKTLADHCIFLRGEHHLRPDTDSTVVLWGTARLRIEVQGQVQLVLKTSSRARFQLEASQNAFVTVTMSENAEGIAEVWDSARITVNLSDRARATVDTLNDARAVITVRDCACCDVNAVDNSLVSADLSEDSRFNGEQVGSARIYAAVQ